MNSSKAGLGFSRGRGFGVELGDDPDTTDAPPAASNRRHCQPPPSLSRAAPADLGFRCEGVLRGREGGEGDRVWVQANDRMKKPRCLIYFLFPLF